MTFQPLVQDPVEINCLRDFGITVTLKQFITSTGQTSAQTNVPPATVTAFISLTNDQTYAVFSGLQVTGQFVGNGKWTFAFGGASLTDALLSQFVGGIGYLFIRETPDELSWIPLIYNGIKQAVVST